jgi:cytochrome c oxidase assembly protein Cox11
VRVVSSKQRRSGGIFCVVGLAIIGFAYVPAQRLLALRAGAHATGVVTQLVSNTANNSEPNIFSDVQFTGANGAVVRFLDRTGSNPAPYKVGDHVAVIYKPENPSSTAMIDRRARNWVPVGMLLLFGGTFAAVGLFSLRQTREQRAD